MTVGVELGRGRLKTADALELKIGDVISLDTAADEPAIVTIEGKPKYLGRVGEKRGSRSVQLVGSIRTKR